MKKKIIILCIFNLSLNACNNSNENYMLQRALSVASTFKKPDDQSNNTYVQIDLSKFGIDNNTLSKKEEMLLKPKKDPIYYSYMKMRLKPFNFIEQRSIIRNSSSGRSIPAEVLFNTYKYEIFFKQNNNLNEDLNFPEMILNDLNILYKNNFLENKIPTENNNNDFTLEKYCLESLDYIYTINKWCKDYKKPIITNRKDLKLIYTNEDTQNKCHSFIKSDEKNNVSLTFAGSLLYDYSDINNDWFKTNIRIKKQKDNRIHKGYTKRYNLIQKEIWEELKKHKNKNLIVSGHSMGSGVAIVFLIDLIEKINKKEIELENINFILVATPMSTSDQENFSKLNEAAENLGIKITTLVNDGDPLICLASNNNQPLGTQIYLGDKKNKSHFSIKNHYVLAYKKNLEKKDAFVVPMEQENIAIKKLEENKIDTCNIL